MSAVEINAGAWYLRALRADDRLSDVPALTDLGLPDPAGYITAAGDRVWAVAVPTTGELVALIGLTDIGDGSAGDELPRVELRGLHRTGYAHALTETAPTVRRFAEQALGLRAGELTSAPP